MGRSKVHDHYAQREQLYELAKRVKSGRAKGFISRKRYPNAFLKQVADSEQSKA